MIEEAWIYLSDCNWKNQFTTEKEEKRLRENKENLLYLLWLFLASLTIEN